MKLGILHGWLLDGSGSNIYVLSLARALKARGHDVHVFCQEPHPDRFPDCGTVHVPAIDHGLMPVYVADTAYEGFAEVKPLTELVDDPRLERYLADFSAGVEKACRERSIEVLHANHVYPMPEIARRVKERLGIPYLVFPHGSAIEYAVKKSPALAEAARRAIDAADALVVGNDVVSRRIWRLYPDRAEAWKAKHSICSVGVDPSVFEPIEPGGRRGSVERMLADAANPGLESALRAVDWDKDRIILFTGKLIVGKGLQFVVAALPAVLKLHPNARLIVAGEGPYRETLEAQLNELGCADRVIFTGYLKHRFLRRLLPCADLAVFPSEVAEAYPLVLLEAISAGVLPAASYFEGLADGLDDISSHLEPGLGPLMRFSMEPEKRVSSITESITGLLSRAPTWRKDCRRLAVEKYSWAAVAAQMERIYAGLI